MPTRERRPGRPDPRAGDRDAVGADAEEHRVREADDAGVAEQQVEARRQDDEDDDLGGDVERLGAGEDERRQRQARRRSRPAASASQRLRGRSCESRRFSMRTASAVGHRDRGPAAATAAPRPSGRCSRTSPASARGSRRSWSIRPTSSAPTRQPSVEPRPPMMMTMKSSTLTWPPICGIDDLLVHAPQARRRGRPAPSRRRRRRRTGAGSGSRGSRPSRGPARRRGSAGRSWCG